MGELTAVAVRNAKPRETMYRLAAGKGLYLQVMSTGARYWRLKYRFAGKPRMMGVGVFPDVSLADARDARDAARKLLASGVDPSMQRRVEKLTQEVSVASSLEAIARLWHKEKAPTWVDTYSGKVLRRLEMHVFPWLGPLPIASVTAPQILATMKRIHESGTTETAHRTRNYLSQIFRFAIVSGKAERDPAADVIGAIPPSEGANFPTITDPARIGELLRAIDGYQGAYVTRYALKFAPLVFTRPGELRMAEWIEVDLAKATWTVPAVRLKMRKAKKVSADPHVVPLSQQAVKLLRDLYPLSGSGRYVFPGERDAKRPMSNNTINAALHRLGFKGEIVHHGMRHMASTALNELDWDENEIERQLAHKDKNRIRGIYNKAKYLAKRKKMMQAWADYLDELRDPRPAVPMVAAKRSARAGRRSG
jgi:integrase